MYKVLLIEDNKFLQKACSDKFKAQGFDLVVAGDGKQGVAKAQAERPDFILLDLIMPVMDGEETLRKLKITPEIKDIPVAILTAVAKEEVLVLFHDNKILDEAVGYWEKDQHNLDMVVNNVRKILEEGAVK